MFDSFKKSEEPTAIDIAIAVVHASMIEYGPDEPEYEARLTYLERLTKLKTENRRPRVNPDTLVNAASGLLGVLVIVVYEQHHVMVSKAVGFLPKLLKST